MADKRISDLAAVTAHAAGDVTVLDGATTRKIAVRDLLGWKEPVAVTGAGGTVTAGDSSIVIQRVAPSATSIQLPSVADQDGQPLHIFDLSTSVTTHAITLVPDGTDTIMSEADWVISSTAAQAAAVTLYPSTGSQNWLLEPARPLASQAEAEAGSDNAKTMTALLTKQSIASEVGVSVQAHSSNLDSFSGKTAPSGTVVGTSDTQTLTGKSIDAASNTISNLATSMFAANVVDNDGTLAANSSTRIPTQAAVKAYADQVVAATDAMVFKGVIDCSANPNYPAADRGWTYKVSVAGKIGGASGVSVEVGDTAMCLTDGTASGNQATVGAQWNIVQANLVGAVTGPSSSTSGNIATFNGTGGTVIQDGGKALPSGAIVGTSDTQTLTNKDLTSGTNTFPTFNQNTTGSAAKLTTARNIDGQAFDGTANITVIAPGTHAATSKTTPVDADELPMVDSAASNVLKKLTWANLKAALSALYATAAQGTKADSAVQTLVEGTNITIDATDPQNPIISSTGGGSGSVANPTATIGLTSVNGSASSAIRSDGAPALSQAIAPTWTELHTFDAGAAVTNPVVAGTFTGSGTDALLAVNQSGAASSATLPEIGAQFTLTSDVGLANSTTAYKIGMTSSVVGGSNSASIYGANMITHGYAGSGGYLVTGIESDINNVGADAIDLGATTAAYGFVAVSAGTAKSTAAYWATAIDPAEWNYGFASMPSSGRGVSAADFYSNSQADHAFYDDGDHSQGITLAGTYSSGAAIVVPSGNAIAWAGGGSINTTAGYLQFSDPANANVFSLGSTDPTNYFSNGAHQFYNRASTVHYGTIDATGVKSDTYLGSAAPVTKTGTSSTLAATDVSVIYNASGTHTTTLPAASGLAGRWLHVKSIAAQAINSASSNVVPLGSATAGTALLASGAGKWASLQSDGTNWVVMAGG